MALRNREVLSRTSKACRKVLEHGVKRRAASWSSTICAAALACSGLMATSTALGADGSSQVEVASTGLASVFTTSAHAHSDVNTPAFASSVHEHAIAAPADTDPDDPARATQLVREGERYENAEGVERDPARALALYCAAARLNGADGFLRMAWMYANARGVQRDDGLAGNLLQRAAALGNQTATGLTALIRPEPGQDRLPECLRPPDPPSAPQERELSFDFDFDDPARAVVLRPLMTPALRARLQTPLVEFAREYQIEPGLVLAVMRAESGFNPRALSPKNAQGLMQLIPETAERFHVRDAFDPVDNLRGGMRYLRWLLSYFEGDVRLALAGYNAGEGAVDRARGVPPWPETRQYIQRIRNWYPHEFHPFEPAVTRPASWLRQQADPAAAEKRSSLR